MTTKVPSNVGKSRGTIACNDIIMHLTYDEVKKETNRERWYELKEWNGNEIENYMNLIQ